MVVCTGQSTVAQRVRGLRLGADDWVTKPCHPEELIARVEAVVRRRKRAEARVDGEPGARVGEVEIRADQFQAFVGGVSADLTRREFELIQLLADAEGQVLAARGDLPARVGLRDGPRRPLGRRLRAQAAPEAREGLAGLALHPHALRDRLPLRGASRWYRTTPVEPDAPSAAAGRRRSRRRRAPSRTSRLGVPVGRSLRPARLSCADAWVRDRKHLRNVAIIIVLALSCGCCRAAARRARRSRTCSASSSPPGFVFLGYRLYMEHRDEIFGLEERQRGILYASLR